MDSAAFVSRRGATYLPQEPKFFHVLDNLWHPTENPEGIVNLGLAENGLMQDALIRFINSQIKANPHALTYGDGFTGSKKLKLAFCHFMNLHFSPVFPLVPDHLLVTPGVGNALECCAWSLCDPGDTVLVGRPYWTAFDYIFGIRAQVEIWPVSFEHTDPFSLEAVRSYAREYRKARQQGKNVKAILLCSPHNPLGRCYSVKVLEEYMRLCGELEMHLLCDEIYALSTFDVPGCTNDVPFTSVLSINPGSFMDPSKVHVLWGLSKDFGATGLRIGCLISQSNAPFLKSLQSFSLFNFPSSLADGVTASLLVADTFVTEYIQQLKQGLARSYSFAVSLFRKHAIPCMSSNAALFLMAKLSAFPQAVGKTDEEISSMLMNNRVYVTSGAVYKSEEPGWFRIVIAHPIPTLEEGIRRIIKALS